MDSLLDIRTFNSLRVPTAGKIGNICWNTGGIFFKELFFNLNLSLLIQLINNTHQDYIVAQLNDLPSRAAYNREMAFNQYPLNNRT